MSIVAKESAKALRELIDYTSMREGAMQKFAIAIKDKNDENCIELTIHTNITFRVQPNR